LQLLKSLEACHHGVAAVGCVHSNTRSSKVAAAPSSAMLLGSFHHQQQQLGMLVAPTGIAAAACKLQRYAALSMVLAAQELQLVP
jgi:hypothetical protein